MKNLITCILLGFCIGNFVSDQALTEALPGVQTHNRSLNPVSISKKQTLRPKLMYGPRFPLENVKKWAHKRQLKELEKNKSPIADKNDTILQKVDSSVHRTETPTTEKYDPAMQKTDSRIVGNPLKVQKNVSIDEETALGESLSNFNGGSDSLEHLENGLFSAGNDGDMQKILSELASENSNDSGDTISDQLEKLQAEKMLEIKNIIDTIQKLTNKQTPTTTDQGLGNFPSLELYFKQKANDQADQISCKSKKSTDIDPATQKWDIKQIKPQDFQFYEEELIKPKHYGLNSENLLMKTKNLESNQEYQMKWNKNEERIKKEQIEPEVGQDSIYEELQKPDLNKPYQEGQKPKEPNQDNTTQNAATTREKQTSNLLLLISLVFVFFCCLINSLLCFFLHIRHHIRR